jgi:hypothetical protein
VGKQKRQPRNAIPWLAVGLEESWLGVFYSPALRKSKSPGLNLIG